MSDPETNAAADARQDLDDEPTPAPRPHGIGSRRDGSKTFTITNRAYLISVESRVGLDLSKLLDDEADDYRRALESALDDGESAASFARGEEDRCAWDAGGNLVALIRADRESGSLLALVIDPGIALLGWQILVDSGDFVEASNVDELADFVADEPEARS